MMSIILVMHIFIHFQFLKKINFGIQIKLTLKMKSMIGTQPTFTQTFSFTSQGVGFSWHGMHINFNCNLIRWVVSYF